MAFWVHISAIVYQNSGAQSRFSRVRDNRIVIVQKGNEQTSWERYKLKLVGYVFLDEVLVRIVAIFDHLTNYDSLLNTLLSRYGKHTHEGGAYEMGHQVLRETSWITETVDLECSSYDDNYEKGVWMDIHSEPLRAVYRSWRNDNFEESKRWPLADW